LQIYGIVGIITFDKICPKIKENIMRIPGLSALTKLSGESVEIEDNSIKTLEDFQDERRDKKIVGLIALAGGVFVVQSIVSGEGNIAVRIFNTAAAAGALAFSQGVAEKIQEIDWEIEKPQSAPIEVLPPETMATLSLEEARVDLALAAHA